MPIRWLARRGERRSGPWSAGLVLADEAVVVGVFEDAELCVPTAQPTTVLVVGDDAKQSLIGLVVA